MEQDRFKFEWELLDGTSSRMDPNLFDSISALAASAAMQCSPSSNWAVISAPVPLVTTLPADPVMERMMERLTAIEQRLAILNLDGDPTHQMLDTLYKKYKMVEALATKKDDGDE